MCRGDAGFWFQNQVPDSHFDERNTLYELRLWSVGRAGLEPAAAQRLPSSLGPCANTTIGVWSEDSLDRTGVVAVYGQPA